MMLVLAGCTQANTTLDLTDGTDTLSYETEEEAVSGTLTFTDAFGQEHTMDVLSSVAQNDYDSSCFELDGQKMSYTDSENYTYRLGVDVSYYQGDIDWKKVAKAGYEFAFIRLGFRGYNEKGNIKLDEAYDTNLQEAAAAGLDVGVYFYSQAITESEAIEEAEYVLSRLEETQLQLPVVYDPEYVYDEDGSLNDEARTSTLEGEQITANALAFCQTIESAGYEAAIYASLLSEAEVFDLTTLSDYAIWYADYSETPQTPYHFTFWQYSETGSVKGIDGDVDLDIQLIQVY